MSKVTYSHEKKTRKNSSRKVLEREHIFFLSLSLSHTHTHTHIHTLSPTLTKVPEREHILNSVSFAATYVYAAHALSGWHLVLSA